jgi:hypothetical protein
MRSTFQAPVALPPSNNFIAGWVPSVFDSKRSHNLPQKCIASLLLGANILLSFTCGYTKYIKTKKKQ